MAYGRAGCADQCESIQSSKVVRELSPKKVYSKDVEQHQTRVPPLFRVPGQLRELRPDRTAATCPRDATPIKPRLLERIEALLEKKLEGAAQLAQQYGPIRADWAAATLRLDAHRQVFETFVNSMTTYRPVLEQIRRHYDAALDEALKSTYEHVHMRAELALADSQRSAAVDAALVESAEKALQLREQLLAQLAGTEEGARAAEAAAAEKAAAVKDAQRQVMLLERKAAQLQQENTRLLQGMQAGSSWAGLASGSSCETEGGAAA